MYKLEDRILFDGAAVADVADAQQEADTQAAEAAAQAAEAEEAAAQEATDSSEGGEFDNSDANDPGSLEAVLAAVEAGLGSDGQRVDVLLVSDSLDNANDICNTANADTIVVRYDARTTSAADLVQQITDALDGNLADSIGFATESGENAAVQLFADTDTSLDTVNNILHQDFFNALDSMMDDGGQVNLFASNLASTEEGIALVDAIGDSLDHDVAASTDETGSESAGGDWNLEYSTNNVETDLAETYLDENLIDNFDSLLEDHTNHEVAFINSSVMNNDPIIEALEARGVDIIHINNGEGLSQINDYLAEHSNIDAIHIITHGDDGYFLVGSDNVNSESLSGYYADSIAAWKDSLSDDADIMIYGCNLAESSIGQGLVDTLASLTGADVAASDDDTGSRGDWSLEYTVGDIETAALAVSDYQYTLANRMVNTLIDAPINTLGDGIYSLRKAIVESEDGDSITFDTYDNLGSSRTITLVSAADPRGYGQLEITKQISIDGTIVIDTDTYTIARVTNATGDDFRLLYITDAAGTSETPVDIYRMDFLNGEAEIRADIDYVGEGNGGAIYNAGAALLRDVYVWYSDADIDGGGIYVASTGYLKLVNDTVGTSDCYVSYNEAGTSGGGIFNNSGTLELVGAGSSETDSEAVFITNNTTSGSGGGIYSVGDITATYASITSNSATGDGGGVYITGGSTLSSFSNSSINSNTASGDGGGIYFFQSKDLTLTSSNASSNKASGDGGGIYVNESRYLRDVGSSINSNTATGDGGGVYLTESGNFYHERGFINSNTAGGSGGAVYMTKSGYGVTDGYLSDLYLYAMDISGNTTTAGNGTVYYDGVRATGVSGAGTTIAYMSAIDTNTVSAGAGGAFYQTAGDLSIWSSTLAFNTAVSGGAIYFSGNALDVEFATLAYNEATTTNNGADIYLAGAPQTFTVINSIIYDNDGTAESQIVIGGTTPVSSTFNNNIYSSYSVDATLDSKITTMVTAGSGNIVGDDALTPITGNTVVSRADIINNLYLDTAMRDYNNFYARVIPLLVDYNQAITTPTFGWRNIAWQAGTATYDSSIAYDTRGNTRTGYQYNESTHAYEQNSTPSIGAFEPIYTIVVNSKGGDGEIIFFDTALTDGITLKEAINWIDSYDAITYANNNVNNGALYNSDRYVKFDSVVFAADADNTITVSDEIKFDKSVIIGMTPWLNDQLDTYKATYADNDISIDEMTGWGGFRAQDATGRITVSGNNTTGIFYTSGSRSTPGTRGIYVNNLTFTNGYTKPYDGGGVGRGGAIWNSTTLYLSNVAVTNSEADNEGASFYSSRGWGGGIYSTGSLTLVDSTVSGNTAIGNSSSTDTADKAGLGGGIYSTGNLTISSSSIYGNTAQGSTYVSSQSADGGGIYFDGGTSNLRIINSTITNNTTDAEYGSAPVEHGQGSAIYLETGDLYMYYNTVVLNTSVRSVAEGTTGISAAIVSEYNYDTTGAAKDFDLYNNIIADNDYSFTGSPKTRNLWDIYIIVDDLTVTPANVIVLNNIIGWTTGLDIYENGDVGATANNDNNIIGDAVYGKVANLSLEETLAYNGGKTKSYKVLDNSVAYQNGLELDGSGGLPTITIDQRGNDRTYAGTTPTIGSYQPVQYIVITSTADTRNGSDVAFNFAENSGGWLKSDLQIREAFALADIGTQVSLGYEASGSAPTTNPIITLNQTSGFGELLADIGFVFDGRSYSYDRSYNTAAAAWTLTALSLNATVNPVIIDASSQSRLIRVSDDTPSTINLTLSYATLQNGSSDTRGGAIYNWENLTLDNISVLNSTSTLQGGGIYSQTGTLTINASTIQGNTSGSQGGGLYYESNSLSITESSFLSNTSTGSGGGFYVVGAKIDMRDSVVGNNISGAHGGGIYSDSSDLFMINSTVANNTADQNGGGMIFNGGGYLRMGYVTIANNISGADPDSVQKLGGGLYQSAGSLNIYDSIIAQNYQTSIAAANLNDFYLGTAVSFTTAQVQNNVLGEYTNNSGNTISTVTNKTRNPDGTYGVANEDLSIDTVLADNGGDTMTIYVFSGSSATIDYAVDLYYTYTLATNTYTLSLASGTQILLDQIGNDRYLAANTITVGAYQKNITEWVYTGNATTTETILEDSANWRDYTTGLAVSGDVVVIDRTLYFDPTVHGAATGTDNVIMTESWDVNYRTSVILDNIAHLMLSGAPSPADPILFAAGLTVMGGSIFTVGSNAGFAAAASTEVNLVGATSQIIVNSDASTFSGTVNVDDGTLTLNASDTVLQNLSIGILNTASTVIYNYAGDQTIKTADYGNLTISGSGTKTADGIITVEGDLDNSSEFTSIYNLTVEGDTTSTGNITAANIYLNGDNDVTGDLSADTGIVTFAGGSSTGTITAVTVNAEGTIKNIDATTINSTSSLQITGTATTTALNANTLVLSSDASVTTVNAQLTTLNSTGSGSSNTFTVTGLDADVNFDTWTINVVSDSMTIDRGDNDILISDGTVFPTPTDPFFHIENMKVQNYSTLAFVTSGDATLENIVSANLPNFNGTLSITCDNVTMPNSDFSGGNMSLIFNNSGYFNLLVGKNLTFGNSISVNNVKITVDPETLATLATLTSLNGDVTIGDVISVDPTYSLALDASNGSTTIGAVTDMTNITLVASTGAGETATVNGAINISGNFTATAETIDMNGDITTGGNVSITGALELDGDITASGSLTVTGATTINGTADTALVGDTLNLGGSISGTGSGDLTIGATGGGSSMLAGIVLPNGSLTISDGDFTSNAAISSIVNVNILSPASLAMQANAINASGSLTNAGTLTSTSTITAASNVTNSGSLTTTGAVTASSGNINNTDTGTFSADSATAGGNITNSGATFTATTLASAGGNITNSGGTFTTATATTGSYLDNGGTFITDTANVGTDLSNTGTMTITSALNLIGTGASTLSMGGTTDLSAATLSVFDKQVQLTNGNIVLDKFIFAGTDSSSIFNLNSQTIEVTDTTGNAIDYKASLGYYDGNYFVISAGGELVQTMLGVGVGNDVVYRVRNNDSVTAVTLQATSGDKIGTGILDSVGINGIAVIGVQETINSTIVLARKVGDSAITVSLDWETSTQGDQFDSTNAERFELIDNVWISQEAVTVAIDTPVAGRSFTTYTQPENGTYTIANFGANMTIPPIPPNPMNVNIYEMANSHFTLQDYDLDSNMMLNFEIGTYPSYSIYGWPSDKYSVGKQVSAQMQSRQITNPLTNILKGQVYSSETLIEEAIAEGAGLNLTSDAPVFLEVNGEYSIGEGWTPIMASAHTGHTEEDSATQGQIDQFYFDFGGRQNVFDKPVSFKSDLDAILDDLLAG